MIDLVEWMQYLRIETPEDRVVRLRFAMKAWARKGLKPTTAHYQRLWIWLSTDQQLARALIAVQGREHPRLIVKDAQRLPTQRRREPLAYQLAK